MNDFKLGTVVKHSEHYFEVLSQVGCTEKSMEAEREMEFKVVELPAKHGSRDSIGISPIDDDSTIIACTKKDVVLVNGVDK